MISPESVWHRVVARQWRLTASAPPNTLDGTDMSAYHIRPHRLVFACLALFALLAVAACGGGGDNKSSGSPTPAASDGASSSPGGPANALLVIGGAESTRAVLEDAFAADAVSTYLLTNRSQDNAAFEGLTVPGAATIWGTQLIWPAADAEAFNTAFQDAYGYAATDYPGSAAAYDAVYVYALAAAAANSNDSAAIRDSLDFVANSPGTIAGYGSDEFAAARDLVTQGQDVNYIGASGQVDFDVAGDLSKGAVQTWKVLNNTVAPIETRDVDSAAETGVEVPTGGIGTGAAAESPLVIGIVITDDDTGTTYRDAALLAADEVNAGGGVFGQDIELAVATMGNGGADAARSLIEESGAQVIIGTTAADAVTDVFNTASASGVPVLSMSMAPELATVQDNNLLFSIAPSDVLQMAVLANLALESDAGSVCVLFEQGEAGQVLADAFKRALEFKEGAVRDSQSYDPSRDDFGELLSSCIGA